MKEEHKSKTLKILESMFHHLEMANKHLNFSLAFSIFGILYVILSAAYIITQEEVSVLNIFLVWSTQIVIYFAQVKGRKEYDVHMKEYKKLNEEYEDLISR